jgi:hypothetical protein
MRPFVSTLVVVGTMTLALVASADDTCKPTPTAAPATWGAPPPPPREDSPVARARELLASAKLLDETAATDEKAAADISMRLPVLRASAKSARERADRATGEDREILVARAEDLEADLAVSEAEGAAKRQAATDNRRYARDLRARAIRIARDPSTATTCDPPYRYTADGRKTYLIECLR